MCYTSVIACNLLDGRTESFENSATGFEPHWEASVDVVQPLKCKPEQMMFFGADWYEPKCPFLP